jgi:hypothetical protein
MPVRLIFRCEFCKKLPGDATRRSLEGQLLELEWGQFTDALPEGWLIWAGKGPYGQTRYACAEHRIELRDFIRRHYGTLGWHPHARVLGDVPPEVRRELASGPAPKRVRTAHQRRLRRNSGFVM